MMLIAPKPPKKIIFILSLLVVVALPATTKAASSLLQEVTITASNAQRAQSQMFTLKTATRTWQVPVSEVRQWFKVRSSDDAKLLQLRPGAIYDYLNRYISPQVNDLGENSRYVRTPAGQVELIKGGRKGQIVDGIKTSLAIRQALMSGKNSAPVAMKEFRPTIFSVEDFSKLKFPQLLSHGETNFAGSPANRIHNIQVATQRYHGLVLLPAEEFSFNQYLGAVDAANGYRPELVIKDNVTTPEYGGGICQVSTTAFRAALQAGLQITNRRNHSYPVAYYGTPGYDATVYAPSTDFRFRNDTAQPVLIMTAVQGTKVVFDIWGTSDGRTVKVNGPFVTEKKPDGSLTAAVAQIVTKQGKTIREQNFVSRYQSPAKFPTIRRANGG